MLALLLAACRTLGTTEAESTTSAPAAQAETTATPAQTGAPTTAAESQAAGETLNSLKSGGGTTSKPTSHSVGQCGPAPIRYSARCVQF